MNPTIVRDPMYQQINKRLRLLVGREYTFGQQFPTEREIVERFAVSRATANKALASLVSEGLLEFRKGIGTFVRQPPIVGEFHRKSQKRWENAEYFATDIWKAKGPRSGNANRRKATSQRI